VLPRRRSVSPAYLIQGQLTGDSAIARTPYTVASNSPKVGSKERARLGARRVNIIYTINRRNLFFFYQYCTLFADPIHLYL
jgi:hypothetical protein